MPTRPAVFLDRDGVINYNRPDYVKSWQDFKFLPGVLEALQRLALLNWPVVVVSNQSVIGRGLASRKAVGLINQRMMALVQQAGGRIDGVYCCPHRSDEACTCRKPHPGLLVRAADRMGLSLAHSVLVGDAESDVMAAHAAGCQPILVKTGRGVEQLARLRQNGVDGFIVADDLTDAVAWIFLHVSGSPQYQVPDTVQRLLIQERTYATDRDAEVKSHDESRGI